MSDIYHGRLVADGEGNLLADEGDRKGYPVAFHDGSYIFLKRGEPSHNERHHQNFLSMESTVDESMTTDPEFVNADESTNPHHFAVQEDDPHYDGIKNEPDVVAAKATGHTDAWSENNE